MVLQKVRGWNRCSEPSQALRASSPGGRAKSLVGVDGWWESQGCGGCRWTEGKIWFIEQTESMVVTKAPLCKGSSAEGGEGLLHDKVEIYMGTNANSYNLQSLCSTDYLPCPIELVQ